MPSSESIPNPALYAGPTLIGCILAYLIFGAVLSQMLTYAANFSRSDGRYHVHHAVIVAGVAILCIFDIYIVTHLTWRRFIVDVGVLPHKWVPPPIAPAVASFNGILAFVVQMFFARKIWLLGCASGKWVQKIPGTIIGNLALMQLGAALASTILFATGGRQYNESMVTAVAIFLVSTLSADIAITVSVIALLAQYQRESVFPTTKTLLNKITRHTIENGMITTICAAGNLAVFYSRDDNCHSVFQYILGQLYALVLIVSLNRAAESSPGTSQGTSGDPESAPGTTIHMTPLSRISTAGGSQKQKRKGRRSRKDDSPHHGGSEHHQNGNDAHTRSRCVHVQVVHHVQNDSDEALSESIVKGRLPQDDWDSEAARAAPGLPPRESEKIG